MFCPGRSLGTHLLSVTSNFVKQYHISFSVVLQIPPNPPMSLQGGNVEFGFVCVIFCHRCYCLRSVCQHNGKRNHF